MDVEKCERVMRDLLSRRRFLINRELQRVLEEKHLVTTKVARNEPAVSVSLCNLRKDLDCTKSEAEGFEVTVPRGWKLLDELNVFTLV